MISFVYKIFRLTKWIYIITIGKFPHFGKVGAKCKKLSQWSCKWKQLYHWICAAAIQHPFRVLRVQIMTIMCIVTYKTVFCSIAVCNVWFLVQINQFQVQTIILNFSLVTECFLMSVSIYSIILFWNTWYCLLLNVWYFDKFKLKKALRVQDSWAFVLTKWSHNFQNFVFLFCCFLLQITQHNTRQYWIQDFSNLTQKCSILHV